MDGMKREWSAEAPEVSGIYLFFDHLDSLAEEISTFEVDVEQRCVVPTYRLGEAAVSLDDLRGVWFGPLEAPTPRT